MPALSNRLQRLEASRRMGDTGHIPFRPDFIVPFAHDTGGPLRLLEVWPAHLRPAIEAEVEALIADRRVREERAPYTVVVRIRAGQFALEVSPGSHSLEALTDEELDVLGTYAAAHTAVTREGHP